jgi:transposase-like protein
VKTEFRGFGPVELTRRVQRFTEGWHPECKLILKIVVAEATPKRAEIPLADRQKIKRDYLLGMGSIHSLAGLYGVNPASVRKWADTENWTSLRELYAGDDVLTLKDQIRSLDEQIEAKPAPKDLDSLFRAKQRCMSMLWGITGHPKPPTGKPPKERNPARDAMMKKLSDCSRSNTSVHNQS